jgi:hypothetical protein
MKDGRRGILAMVAAGRITAGEAERLIVAWNEGREGVWIALAVVAACAIQADWSWAVHSLHSLMGAWPRGLHGAVWMAMKGMGGRI